MTIVDTILREDIFDRVSEETSWTGKADGDADGRAINETERGIFERKFSRAVTEAAVLVQRYGTVEQDGSGDAVVSLVMPSNYPATEQPRTVALIAKYLTSFVKMEWAATVKDERLQLLQSQAEASGQEVLLSLRKRVKPLRNE